MAGAQPRLVQEDPQQPGGGSTGGSGGDLVGYRLGELERRVGTLEQSISDPKETVARLDSNVKEAVARIETSMEGVATKHAVAFWIMGAVVVNFLAVACHLLIRSLGSG